MSAYRHSIDSTKFLSYFDQDSRLVKEHEFRKSVFRDGIENDYRETVWKFLYQFYPFNSTKRERFLKNQEKLIEYSIMKLRWNQIFAKINENLEDENYDQLIVQPLNFGLKIDTEQDFYRLSSSSVKNDSDLIETAQDLNSQCIIIQSILNISRINISNSQLMQDIRQIDKDVERTSYIIELSNEKSATQEELKKMTNSLRNILITFSAFNQKSNDTNLNFDLGYTQGMNEIASVFLSVFNEESVAYWCFSNYMLHDTYSNSSMTLNTTQLNESHVLKTSVAHYFSTTGMSKKLKHLSYLLSVTDPDVYSKLAKLQLESLAFCHEWLLLSFKRCFKTTFEYQNCFEALSSHFIELHNSALKNISVQNLYTFDLFISLSLLKKLRNDILENCESETDFYEAFSEFNKSKHFSDNFREIVKDAEDIFDEYCIISLETNGEKTIKRSINSTIRSSFKTRLNSFKFY